MIRLPLLRAFSYASLLLGLSGCHHDPDAGSAFPRSETLYVGGRQWGEPSSFNPLLGWPTWPSIPGVSLLYEPLFFFDMLSGKLSPLLGESYTQTDDAIEVVINAGAHWSDGQPVTGRDVKYTYDLGQKYKGLSWAPIWSYLSEIKLADDSGSDAPGKYPRRVVFVLSPEQKNPLVVLDALQDVRIVPKHVIEPLLGQVNGNIDEFDKLKFDKDPVGSGPYKLLSYSSEKIAMVRDDAYWGNKALHGGKLAAPKYVVHPIYKSNSAFSIALQQGRVDASSSYMPRIWLKQKKGVHSWYEDAPYFIPSSIPLLFVNVKHAPLGDVKLRRAMALAINYKDIRELAVSGYSEPLRPGLILPFGLESKYYSEEDAKKYGASHTDPAAAKALLAEAGYKPVWGPNGDLVETRDPSGKQMPTVFIKSPSGWTDWESIVRIVVRSMRAVGIDARERFIDSSLYWNALNVGDFDLIMNTPASPPMPSKPWSRLEAVLTTKDFAPLGEKMYKNIGRFNDPKQPGYVARFDELLDLIPKLKDDAELLRAYHELNALVMQYQPVLPLVYRPDQFYEFSLRHWVNFPTAEHPFLPPQLPGDRMGAEILWAIKPHAE